MIEPLFTVLVSVACQCLLIRVWVRLTLSPNGESDD